MPVPLFLERAQWFSLLVMHSLDVLRHTQESSDAVARHLASIKGVSPSANSNGVIFFACDSTFMKRFGLALIASCYENACECSVHVHLFQPTSEILHDVETAGAKFQGMPISYTYEDAIDFGALRDPGMYYTAFRFVAVRKLVEESRSLFICLDADSLVVNSPHTLIAELTKRDVGLCFRLNRRHVNKKILAYCVAFNHTPGAIAFLDLFAAISLKFRHHYVPFRSGFYFDQSGLYFAYLISRLWRSTFYAIRKTVVSYAFTPGACIWTAKGVRKHDPVFLDEGRRVVDKYGPWP
ncbi:MAG TPA: hypothetical protein VMW56_06620 [Candidatus Margulisiibacteriota bacterium]|nr:hypothetical protein [Candidatus Margulisiibacteriota bacterium]